MKKRKGLIITLIILVLLLIIVGIIGIFIVNKINSKIDKIDYQEINKTDLGISEEQKKSKFRNIAILGTDSRYDDYNDLQEQIV